MVYDSLRPKGLIKLLVGEILTVSLELNPKFEYEVEIYTNINQDTKNIALTRYTTRYQIKIPLTKSGFFNFSVRFRKVKTKTWYWLTDNKRRKIVSKVQVDPSWLSQAIVYCIFVRFFKGKVHPETVERLPASRDIHIESEQELKQKSINTNEIILPGDSGTFDDVKEYLDTLVNMNVNVLYFNPIHMIGELYRGYNMMDQLPAYLQPGSPYSVKDYKSIDPELTYDKDTKKHLLSDPHQEFKDLIDAAHERGMFVFMDLVFNHTAHDFVYQRIRPEWYLYKEHINNLEEPYLTPDDVKMGKPWGDPKHSMAPYDHGIFWEDCAQLNWEHMLPPAPNNPPPNYSLHEMWDYFKAIPQYWIKHFAVDGFRGDAAYRIPSAFWKACIGESRDMARAIKNNLSHDVVFVAETYTDSVKELQEAGFSAVYGDFSHKLTNPITLKGYLDYIYNISGDFFPKGSRWFHFPDSHDFDRAPRKILGDQGGDPVAATRVNQSRWLLTATLPGIPLLFNGFEKIEWQPINIWSYGAIDWAKNADLKDFITKVNRIRKRLPPLQKGNYTYLPTNQGLDESTQLMAYMREYQHQQVIVVVNMDVHRQAGPTIISLPNDFDQPYVLYDHMTEERYERQGNELTVILGPGQCHIFEVRW
jgi:glycosidase